MASLPAVRGVVEEWDDARGTGTIRPESGPVLDLQCTDLADGTRSTTVGTVVWAVAVAGHHGRWQARHVVVDT